MKGSLPRTCMLATLAAAGCGSVRAEPSPPNVVVISVDGLRLDRTGFGGGPHSTTPNLDALVADSVWFENGFSQSNESLLSHASLFTGRHPLEISVPEYLRYVMGDEQLTFPEVLQQVGYETAAVFASGHVGEAFGFNQGFDVFYEGERWGSFQETVPVALSWLEQRPADAEPFALFLHAYDCHRPFARAGVFHHPFDEHNANTPIEPLLANFNHTERIIHGVYYPDLPIARLWNRTGLRVLDPRMYSDHQAEGQERAQPLDRRALDHLKAHYDSAVLTADTFLGFFFEGLDALKLWENTVVIVVADHGEDLQDHGFTNHRAVIFDSTTRVPWVMGGGAIPDAWRGARPDALADAVDLVPTLTDIAGTVPPAGIGGRSLWAVMQGAVDPKEYVFQTGVLGQVSVRTREHRLVFSGLPLDHPLFAERLREAPISSEHFALFAPDRDPLEQTDIKADAPELAEKLRQALSAWYDGQVRSSTAQTLTEAQLQALRDGGYW